MKQTLLTCCIALIAANLCAQSTPGVTHGVPNALYDSIMKARLPELVMTNPQLNITELEKAKTRAEITKSGAAWLNYVTGSVNINDVTTGAFRKNNPELANLYYPLWNIGITVPLGSLISKPADVKIARRNNEIAIERREGMERLLKRQVLSLFEEFRMKRDLLEKQDELTEESAAAMETAEVKLAGGTGSAQEFATARNVYYDHMARQRMLQKEKDVAELEIEELIGMPMENVVGKK